MDNRCDRCGEKYGPGDPFATLHYSPPFSNEVQVFEICKGCDAELKAFWNMEGGDFAREKLEKAREKSQEVLQ